jgi:hypothetical protein
VIHGRRAKNECEIVNRRGWALIVSVWVGLAMSCSGELLAFGRLLTLCYSGC